jgi:hypothetical protein
LGPTRKAHPGWLARQHFTRPDALCCNISHRWGLLSDSIKIQLYAKITEIEITFVTISGSSNALCYHRRQVEIKPRHFNSDW